uniref:Uncharacterized protein n=1 Tax=Rhizophora mucronata TaxID=61149 RepID=A0A2P2J2H7_RHIMU
MVNGSLKKMQIVNVNFVTKRQSTDCFHHKIVNLKSRLGKL